MNYGDSETACATKPEGVVSLFLHNSSFILHNSSPPPADKTTPPPAPDSSSKMKLSTLEDLYIHEIKDLYSAEKQIAKVLPKMAKAASNKELAAGFEAHLVQTKAQVVRLEKILESHGMSMRVRKCKGMEGVLKEGEEMIEEEGDPEVRDAGLISAAQRVEHYEIAGFGCARAYAELLGDKEGAKLLKLTEDEAGETDRKLTELARTVINVHANK